MPLEHSIQEKPLKRNIRFNTLKMKILKNLVLFFEYEKQKIELCMSQEAKNRQSGEKDMTRVANERGVRKNYEGFEGMNYEQVRQPYNPRHRSRNSNNDEGKDNKRPDEG